MEFLDTYNARRERTGRIIPRDAPLLEGERLLVVHLCLFSPRGELLIQRRQLRKERYPGCWDVSAGGFVRSGEEPAQAVLREAREELGLVLSPAELRYELTEPFSFVLDDFYSARRELAPSSLRLQEEELSQVCWAGPGRVLRLLERGEFVDYSPALISRLFAG